jgi:hypothetical protein
MICFSCQCLPLIWEDIYSYGGEEIFKRLGIDEGEVHCAEHPSKWICDRCLQTVPGAADGFFLATVGEQNAVLGHFSLLLGQPFGVLGPIREDEECSNSDKYRNATLNDEEPLPAVHARDATHLVQDAGGQETGDDVRDGVASVPDSHSHGVLGFGVP